jgi:hypothetical protein
MIILGIICRLERKFEIQVVYSQQKSKLKVENNCSNERLIRNQLFAEWSLKRDKSKPNERNIMLFSINN